jgi:CPA2 family monovalent cation:H+ antiporter-2
MGEQRWLSPLGLGAEGSQVFISATVILIALTPVLFSLGDRLQTRLQGAPAATA